MNTSIVTTIALQLMAKWNLTGWTFGFNRRKAAMGLCRYNEKRLELSLYFVANNPEERIRQTILHEIAHALAGPAAGHGHQWRVMALLVGAPPVRCGRANMPEGAWKATCSQCGKTHSIHRKPKRNYRCTCRATAPRLVWQK